MVGMAMAQRRPDLDEILAVLRQRLHAAESRLEGIPGDARNGNGDEGDLARASTEQELTAAARQQLVENITRLRRAIARIETDEYGACTVCRRPIPTKRLLVFPEAETCVRCQEQLEERARQRRGGWDWDEEEG